MFKDIGYVEEDEPVDKPKTPQKPKASAKKPPVDDDDDDDEPPKRVTEIVAPEFEGSKLHAGHLEFLTLVRVITDQDLQSRLWPRLTEDHFAADSSRALAARLRTLQMAGREWPSLGALAIDPALPKATQAQLSAFIAKVERGVYATEVDIGNNRKVSISRPEDFEGHIYDILDSLRFIRKGWESVIDATNKVADDKEFDALRGPEIFERMATDILSLRGKESISDALTHYGFGLTEADHKKRALAIRKVFAKDRPRFKTGLATYDQRAGGFQPGEVVLIGSGTGMGKCLTGEALVPTDRGLVSMKEVAEGRPDGYTELDIGVHGVSGLERTSHLYRETVQQVFRLETEFGFVSTSTGSHRVYGLSGDALDWKHQKELKVGDYLVCKIGQNLWGSTTEIPAWTPPAIIDGRSLSRVSLEYPRQVTLSLAKVLGYLVSEGYYNHKLTFTNFDQEVMNDYLENFSACFPNVSTDVAPSHREAAHSMTVEVQSFLEHIGFNKGLSKDRCVPLCIRTAPRHLVAAFLSALFEGDGYCLNDNRKQVWFTTTSRTLHDQVKVMLANLGILTLSSTAVKSATNGKPGNKSTAYNLIIGHKFVDAFAAEIGFVSSTKKKQLAGVLRRGASHSVGRKTEYLLGVSTVASAAYDYLLASGARAPNEATRGRLKQAKKRNRFTKMTIADVVSIAKTYHMSGSTPGFALLEALTDPTVYLDEVKSITSINEPTQVYDFVVPGTHSFSANGLMQHNTALELTLMTNMARLGYSPAMLQLELTETQISERLASNLGNIDSEIIRSGNINEKYQKRIIEASEEFHEELKVAKSRLTFFTPSSATIQECEYAFKTFKYDVWFIDYINLLKWEGGGKERSGEDWTRLSDIVKEFKRLAKKHGVAVVLAVQVNIDKDSGDIEIRYAKAMKEHADVVLVWNLDSNARKDGVVWLRHLKARQYEGFDFPIRVALNYCRFESVNMSQMPKVEERRLGSKGKIRREREEPKDDDVFQRKTKALPDTPSATKVPVAPEQDEDVLELVAKANKRAAIPLDDEEERYKELDDD